MMYQKNITTLQNIHKPKEIRFLQKNSLVKIQKPGNVTWSKLVTTYSVVKRFGGMKTNQYTVEVLDTTQDYEHQSKGPTLKHFRSTSLKEVETYLKSCWEKCE